MQSHERKLSEVEAMKKDVQLGPPRLHATFLRYSEPLTPLPVTENYMQVVYKIIVPGVGKVEEQLI